MSDAARIQLDLVRKFLAKESVDPNALFMGIELKDFTPEELRKIIGIMARLLGKRSKKTPAQDWEDLCLAEEALR